MHSDNLWSFSCATRTTSNLRSEPRAEVVSAPELLLLSAPLLPCAGRRYALNSGSLQIGRDVPDTQLRVSDPSMSRLHARCTRSGTGPVRLTDCESRNGTFVNGKRVADAVLEEGDIIRLGESLFAYLSADLMPEVLEQARVSAGAGLSVLLRGETGTGKEVLARQIHAQSQRRGRFVAVNCASLPKDLAFAELFGHAKGAFSGALQRRAGLFVAAQGGTLLLDEVGDCPTDVQAGLLRALQERCVRPLGEDREVPIDVQLIAATHRDLESAIERGGFRADLLARLAQSVVTLPPLRRRRHHILSLFSAFVQEHGCEVELHADAAEALLLWDYPFNIREIQSVARLFAAAHAPRAELSLSYLERRHPNIAARLNTQRGLAPHRAGVEATRGEVSARAQRRETLKSLLETHAGNVSKVAETLGKPRAQIYRWLNASGLCADTIRRQRQGARPTGCSRVRT